MLRRIWFGFQSALWIRSWEISPSMSAFLFLDEMSLLNHVKVHVDHDMPAGLKPELELKHSHDAVLQRQTVNLPPVGPTEYRSAGGGSTMTFRMQTDTKFVDAHSAMLYFQLNLDQVRGGGGVARRATLDEMVTSVFSRVVLMVNNQVVTDIQDLDAFAKVMVLCSTSKSYYDTTLNAYTGAYRHCYKPIARQDLMIGPGAADEPALATLTDLPEDAVTMGMPVQRTCEEIQDGSSRHFCIPLSLIIPLFGLEKSILPLGFMGDVEITFYLNSSERALVTTGAPSAQFGAANQAGRRAARPWWFQLKGDVADANIGFVIKRPFLCYDTLMVDSEIQRAYARLVASPQGLIIRWADWTSTRSTLLSNNSIYHLNLPLSHVKSVLSVIRRNTPTRANVDIFHPHGFKSARLLIGGETLPLNPISSVVMALSELKKATGAFDSHMFPDLLDWQRYNADSFILGFNVEKERSEGVSTVSSKLQLAQMELQVDDWNVDPHADGNVGLAAQVPYVANLISFVHYDTALILHEGAVELIK